MSACDKLDGLEFSTKIVYYAHGLDIFLSIVRIQKRVCMRHSVTSMILYSLHLSLHLPFTTCDQRSAGSGVAQVLT